MEKKKKSLKTLNIHLTNPFNSVYRVCAFRGLRDFLGDTLGANLRREPLGSKKLEAQQKTALPSFDFFSIALSSFNHTL